MAQGEYSAGKEARLFLQRRLRECPVAVEQLIAEARSEDISRRTLYRAAKRLGVVNRAAWALPGEPVPSESEGRAVALAPVTNDTLETVIVAETDPRIEEFVADIRRREGLGQRRGPLIHRIRKVLGAETADAVRTKLEGEK